MFRSRSIGASSFVRSAARRSTGSLDRKPNPVAGTFKALSERYGSIPILPNVATAALQREGDAPRGLDEPGPLLTGEFQRLSCRAATPKTRSRKFRS